MLLNGERDHEDLVHAVALRIPRNREWLVEPSGVRGPGGERRLSGCGLPVILEEHPRIRPCLLRDLRLFPILAAVGADLDAGDATVARPCEAEHLLRTRLRRWGRLVGRDCGLRPAL